MVSSLRRPRLTLPAAPTAGAIAGLAVAIGFALIPLPMLESLVRASGLPAVVAAAEPPFRDTARPVLVILGGGFAGLLVWLALASLIGNRTIALGRAPVDIDDLPADMQVPVLRRADAHPDAPPRAPLFANRELGTPFLDVHAKFVAGPLDAGDAVLDDDFELVRDVPDDLDMPLAVFDPDAFTAATGAPAPLPRFAPGERIETFELTPIVRSAPTNAAPRPLRQPAPRDTEATITALLERLERGVTERADRLPPVTSRAALGSLRRLAGQR